MFSSKSSESLKFIGIFKPRTPSPASVFPTPQDEISLVNAFYNTFKTLDPPSHLMKKVLRRQLVIIYKEEMSEIYEEKINELMNQPPFATYLKDQIFVQENLHRQMIEKAQPTPADEKKGVTKCLDRVRTEEFGKMVMDLTDALSDAAKFKAMYFDSSSTELKRMASIECDDPHDVNTAITKYQNDPYLAFKLLLTSLGDYLYDEIGIKRKITFHIANATQKWGATHAGLQVGPYIIDWNDSSLIIPRMLSSKHAKALVPINSNVQIDKDKSLTAIAEAIVTWNTQFSYDNMNFSTTKFTGNCQHFVQFVIDKLGITTSWTNNGPVAQYIDKVKSGAMGKYIFVRHPDGSDVKIDTHDQLREFWEKTILKDAFNISNPRLPLPSNPLLEEYASLLKCIERSMQLRGSREGNEKDEYKVVAPIFGDFTGKVH